MEQDVLLFGVRGRWLDVQPTSQEDSTYIQHEVRSGLTYEPHVHAANKLHWLGLIPVAISVAQT